MEQLDQQVHHHLKQKIQNPTNFNIKAEPSIILTQFATKHDPSFNSYLQTNHSNEPKTQQDSSHNTRNATEDNTDQISIFDAAKYFSRDLNDDHTNINATSPMQNNGSSKVIDLNAIGRLSSVSSSTDNISNYRGRSFHATPTASSEASWNSRTGLLTNPHGSRGVNINSFSPNSTLNDDNVMRNGCKSSTKWYRIVNKYTKWFIPPIRKCPCSGKKSVQVEERIVHVKAKTPRMASSNGSKSNASSFYSTRQNSPCNSKSLSCNIARNGCSSRNSLKLVVDDGNNDISSTSGITSHGFTFPILEDEPVAAKKMFNVILSDRQELDPSRDSLEVFQLPKSRTSPRSRRMSYEEENVSDGSSDLFEIESFSMATYPCRNSIDANENNVVLVNNNNKFGVNNEESMMDNVGGSNECYAPSEVSVNLSECESENGIATVRKVVEKNGGGVGKEYEGKNGGISVGPRPNKCWADGPPVMVVGRHVGGREEVRQERKLGQVGNNGNGKVGLVVGRQMSNIVPMPLAT